jgi:hypothetical protein
MEPEENTVETEQSSALHTVTPLSKYLAMVLFVALPFLGGWIGYTYAPEKVVEVERVVIEQTEATQEEPFKSDSLSQDSSPTRLVIERKELIENENYFMEEFNIEFDETNGTADLYWQRAEDQTNTAVFLSKDGLKVMLPYNEGWGSPHYKLTPYDIEKDVVVYGAGNPCPAGCSGTGAYYSKILFHPVSDKDELLIPHVGGSCDEIQLNKDVTATKCHPDGMALDYPMFVVGSNFIYEFKNWQCQEDYSYYLEKDDQACISLNQSFQVDDNLSSIGVENDLEKIPDTDYFMVSLDGTEVVTNAVPIYARKNDKSYFYDGESGTYYYSVQWFGDERYMLEKIDVPLFSAVDYYPENQDYLVINERLFFHDFPCLSDIWSCDNVYELKEVIDVDIETFDPNLSKQFEISQGNYFKSLFARDKNHVFYDGEIVPELAPDSFIMTDAIYSPENI